MSIKRIAALALALTAAALLLCGCTGQGGQSEKNADKYGAAVDFEGPAYDDACVFFVNVGKADCAIVRVDGRAWLIDTGLEESFINVYAALESLGIKKLAGIILTHEHSDHAGGLESIYTKYPAERVYSPEYLLSSIEIDSVVEDLGAAAQKLHAGDTIPVAEGVEFEVLAPEKLLANDDNDNSLVLRLAINGRVFLFTGDMQLAEEQVLMASGAQLAADVLKVPNHGNKDATSAAFAQTVSPLIAVISTDTNVDANSSNSIVKSRLAMADIMTTQDTGLGILLTISKAGEIAVSTPKRAEAAASAKALAVTDAGKTDQTFTVENTGSAAVDISGWYVYSSKGYEVFVFPQGTVVEPGAKLLVACKKSPLADSADLVWQKKKVWADNKQDYAVLCDPNGNELSRFLSK